MKSIYETVEAGTERERDGRIPGRAKKTRGMSRECMMLSCRVRFKPEHVDMGMTTAAYNMYN